MAKLEIYGWLLETSWGVVPSDQVDDLIAAIKSESFDRDDFEDILDENNETGIGTDLDIEILFNNERKTFDPSDFEEEVSEPVVIEDEAENKFFLIEETASKGLVYQCDIEDDYDPDKLEVWFYHYNLGNSGRAIEVMQIEYDGLDCEDRNTEVKVYDVKLLKPDGELHESEAALANEFEIFEVSDQEKFKKIYIFKEKSSYENFCKHIAENLQDHIDRGIDETVITYSGPYADELTICFENTSFELQFTPDPDTGWVEEEIGPLEVRWEPHEPEFD